MESEPNRMQQWLVPSPDPGNAAQAVLFRPPGDGPFPLALTAHASTQNVLRRAQMPRPEYRALAAWLVARGFAVLVPTRPGHGLTGGKYLEDQGGCDEADYSRAGRATAESMASALSYLRGQSFVRQEGAVILGHSAGGWGALAFARENRQGLAAIVAFAPGRGGHANDFSNQVCAPHTLMASAAEFGHGAGAANLVGGGQRQVIFPGAFQTARRRLFPGRRQSGFPCAAGVRGRGPLAGGDRGRCKGRRAGAGARADTGRWEAG
jgi:dienelactone hydrolase